MQPPRSAPRTHGHGTAFQQLICQIVLRLSAAPCTAQVSSEVFPASFSVVLTSLVVLRGAYRAQSVQNKCTQSAFLLAESIREIKVA